MHARLARIAWSVAIIIFSASCGSGAIKNPVGSSKDGAVVFYTTVASGWQQINVSVEGASVGALTAPALGTPPSCGSSGASGLWVLRTPGTYRYSATANTGMRWEGSVTIPSGECSWLALSTGNQMGSGGGVTPPGGNPGGTTPPGFGATLIIKLDGSSCAGLKTDRVTVYVDGREVSGDLNNAFGGGRGAGELRVTVDAGSHVIRAESRSINWPTSSFTVPANQQFTTFTFYCK